MGFAIVPPDTSPDMEESGIPFDGLSPGQVLAVEALMTSKDYIEAAAKAGVTRQTLNKWLKEPDFRTALRAVQAELFEELSWGLLKLSQKAVAAFDSILETPTAPGSAIRRAAANDVISHAIKLRELIGIENRIEDLERRLSEGNGGF